MSSGAHLSKELYDLIKSIGDTRSKQDEDKVIQADMQSLKTKINEKNTNPKKMKEYLIRAIYIEMLGHDASFAYIHAVNLSQNKTLSLKRMGYLASSLFFGPESEFLILLVATLQKDLMSKEPQEIMTALNTVSKLVSASIVSALVDPVTKLLSHTNEAIRKKAIMALHKIHKISPSSVTDFNDKLKKALCDRDPSVMGASLNAYYELSKKNPQPYKELASSFVAILKQILENKLPRDYDYHRIPAPWIQIKLLQILGNLGSNDPRVSDQIYEILGQTMRRADDTGINIGYAITYQCVKTIATIYPNQRLLESAANSVSKFLNAQTNTNWNNLKYLGINALISIVTINPKYALEHQLTVVDCLESKDETLKRETLDLLYKMTNPTNVEVIVTKLINYLKNASDPHFRKDLGTKIIQISEQFAPSQEWYIKTMNTVMEYGNEFVDENSLTNILKLIEENFSANESFGEFLITSYSEDLDKPNVSDSLAKIASWVLGEIGSRLYANDSEKIHSLATVLGRTIEGHHEDESVKSWALTALAKLSCQASSSETKDFINQIFAKYSRSKILDIQQRSLEFQRFSKSFAQRGSVDPSLSFLSSYVDKAIARGAKKYEPNRPSKNIARNLGIDTLQPTNELLTTPYKPYEGKSSSTIPDSKTDTGLNVSKKKWDATGFVSEKVQDNMFTKPGTMSGTSWPSLSSEMKTGGQAFHSGQAHLFAPTTTAPAKVETKPAYVDPALEEKQRLASLFFGGLGGTPAAASSSTSTTSSYNTTTAPKTPTTTYQQTSTSTSIQQKPQQRKEVDLLDLEFESDNNVQKSGSDLLDLETIPSKPSFQPLNIDRPTYEKYWTSIPGLMDESIRSNVKTAAEFKKALGKINFSVIGEGGNEMICAGKSNAGEIILLYAKVNPNGSLDLKLKSNQKVTMQDLLNALKSVC